MGTAGSLLPSSGIASFVDQDRDPDSPQIPTAAPDNGHAQSLDEKTTDGATMNICIIGGGASGLSALQVIMGTPQYKTGHWKPTLFEARDKAGGVW